MTSEVAAADSLATALKNAMRGFAQSVVIITTVDEEGKRYAMAATAVTPLSMDPPSMLICVNRSVSSHKILEGGANFSLNILSVDQVDIARNCGGGARGEDRFSTGNWVPDDDGIPYVADAQAIIRCHQRQRISYGSHDIFIGDVLSVELADAVDPLIYMNGAYRHIGERL
ncbi:MAG: flavin reductase [Sphingobium sp.]|nr:flavin reductase [Sphingobium sp.]